jgi:hypothetical protein
MNGRAARTGFILCLQLPIVTSSTVALAQDTPGAWGPPGGPVAPPPRDPPVFSLPPAEYLEKSSIFYNVPAVGPTGFRGNVPLFFEAQVAPHLFFYNGLGKIAGSGAARRWWERVFFAGSLTAQFRLRMVFNSDEYGNASSPVRPVSFMPRLNLQWFYFDRVREAALPNPNAMDPDKRAGWESLVRIISPRLGVGHHSNGQEHCRFDKSGTLDGMCPAWDGNLSEVNFRSGDFSTNYIIAALNASWLWLEPDTNFEHQRLDFGLLYEANPKHFGGGSGLNDQEYPLYGANRLQGEVGGSYFQRTPGGPTPDSALGRFTGLWSASVAYMQIFGARSDIASYRLTAEVSRTFYWLGGMGLFVRFFSGQDYLNILFVQKIPYTFQIGVVFDQTPRLQYRLQPGL